MFGICADRTLLVYESVDIEKGNLSKISDEMLYGWMYRIDEEKKDYYSKAAENCVDNSFLTFFQKPDSRIFKAFSFSEVLTRILGGHSLS